MPDEKKVLAGRLGGLKRAENGARGASGVSTPTSTMRIKKENMSNQTNATGGNARKRKNTMGIGSSNDHDDLLNQLKFTDDPHKSASEARDPDNQRKQKRAKTGNTASSNLLGQLASKLPVLKEEKPSIVVKKAAMVPRHLPQLTEYNNQMVSIPVTLNLGGGRAIEISDRYDPKQEWNHFWIKIIERVQSMMKVCSDETSGTVLEGFDDELRLDFINQAFQPL